MKKIKVYSFFFVMIFAASGVSAQKFQEILDRGSLSGNIQIDAQYYITDSLIGAKKVPEKVLSNSFANLLYTNGKFTVGARFEAYLGPMLGYDERYKGVGIPYRFARFQGDIVDITAGTFYEQFGSGVILRTYNDWNLGYDNAFDGVRAIINPTAGITIKGLIATERSYWEEVGLVRGLDAEFALNDFIKPMKDLGTRITLGGSFVSKYQASQVDIITDAMGMPYEFNFPENVGAFGGRLNIETDLGITFGGEYTWKDRDPSTENGKIYKTGQALILNLGYSTKGFGILLSAKSIDNMGFRTRRTGTKMDYMINYLPALSKVHGYSLAGFYPYATQPNGEVGFQADIFYKIKKGTVLGGKYGMDIKLNYAYASSIKKEQINPETPIGAAGTLGYKSSLFAMGDELYFSDFNIELSRRFGKKVKASVMYVNQIYNMTVIEGHEAPNVYANIGIADVTYMFDKKNALRLEYQYLATKQDEGDWMMGTLEYTISPAWFFSVSDMYNNGNADKERRLHYYSVSAGYVKGATRLSLSYGRIREGIVCAGGVCRVLPASNGLMFTLTSSF